jgi:hypothetical protein
LVEEPVKVMSSKVSVWARQWFSEQRVLALSGMAVLVFLVGWWAISFHQDRLVGGAKTWVPAWSWMGCDFEHNYFAARRWLEGGNPYESFPRRIAGKSDQYVYPPAVLGCFSWCGWLEPRPAYLVWLLALGGITALATVMAWKMRQALGLWQMPLGCALAAILASYPILFEMERGNCNLLALLFMIGALWAMSRTTLIRDLVAGLCLAMAAWVKIYPGILLLALLFFRRWRVAAICSLAGLAIGLANIPGVLAFVHNLREQSNIFPDSFGFFFLGSHTLSGSWRLTTKHIPIPGLSRIPGPLAWGLVILPFALWVSAKVSRSPRRLDLQYPYWLWLTAAGTFLPLGANDYNLFFLPLAALTVWDRRDPVKIHLLMALMLLWWQPFHLRVGASFLFLCKLIGLYAAGWSLANRAAEQAAVALDRGTIPGRFSVETIPADGAAQAA